MDIYTSAAGTIENEDIQYLNGQLYISTHNLRRRNVIFRNKDITLQLELMIGHSLCSMCLTPFFTPRVFHCDVKEFLYNTERYGARDASEKSFCVEAITKEMAMDINR